MRAFAQNFAFAVLGLCLVGAILASLLKAGAGPLDLPWSVLIFAIGLIAIVARIVSSELKSARRKRLAVCKLQQRTPLDAETFGRTYFGESDDRAAVAADLRGLIQHETRIPLEGLHPDDHLDELGLHIDDPCFLFDLDRLFGIVVSPVYLYDSCDELKEIKTFRELLNYVERKLIDRLSKPMHIGVSATPRE